MLVNQYMMSMLKTFLIIFVFVFVCAVNAEIEDDKLEKNVAVPDKIEEKPEQPHLEENNNNKKTSSDELGEKLDDGSELDALAQTDTDSKVTRKKKSTTTTFCVEIRPSSPDQKPFQVCDAQNPYYQQPSYEEPKQQSTIIYQQSSKPAAAYSPPVKTYSTPVQVQPYTSSAQAQAPKTITTHVPYANTYRSKDDEKETTEDEKNPHIMRAQMDMPQDDDEDGMKSRAAYNYGAAPAPAPAPNYGSTYGAPSSYVPVTPHQTYANQHNHNGLVITCQPNLAGYAHNVPSSYNHPPTTTPGHYRAASEGMNRRYGYANQPYGHHPYPGYQQRPLYTYNYAAPYKGPSNYAYAPSKGQAYAPPPNYKPISPPASYKQPPPAPSYAPAPATPPAPVYSKSPVTYQQPAPPPPPPPPQTYSAPAYSKVPVVYQQPAPPPPPQTYSAPAYSKPPVVYQQPAPPPPPPTYSTPVYSKQPPPPPAPVYAKPEPIYAQEVYSEAAPPPPAPVPVYGPPPVYAPAPAPAPPPAPAPIPSYIPPGTYREAAEEHDEKPDDETMRKIKQINKQRAAGTKWGSEMNDHDAASKKSDDMKSHMDASVKQRSKMMHDENAAGSQKMLKNDAWVHTPDAPPENARGAAWSKVDDTQDMMKANRGLMNKVDDPHDSVKSARTGGTWGSEDMHENSGDSMKMARAGGSESGRDSTKMSRAGGSWSQVEMPQDDSEKAAMNKVDDSHDIVKSARAEGAWNKLDDSRMRDIEHNEEENFVDM